MTVSPSDEQKLIDKEKHFLNLAYATELKLNKSNTHCQIIIREPADGVMLYCTKILEASDDHGAQQSK